ncbi:DUF1127 domain-containing protein [Terrihabitans rhizophilus]|jgi:uncharacterized protein YjiS (DUF1127 family)|uniref:DUF1127 domain-containing protein n=1 Tax=Terrihabitans rhizophilus TaxID=3092662 RepID=A0ABU4RPW8_9HYPH|nr:DUF1127 domain-containing protein [Terrihabitans sp. PJ23]MDX6806886.1 DUF1127 domain-containing protein [Terrihabitans sp. PJ23]
MSHTEQNSTVWAAAGTSTNTWRDVMRFVSATAAAIINRYVAGRTLAGFDDRMLSDIGLTRGDVSSAFSEPVWKDPTIRLSVIAIERRAASRRSALRRQLLGRED